MSHIVVLCVSGVNPIFRHKEMSPKHSVFIAFKLLTCVTRGADKSHVPAHLGAWGHMTALGALGFRGLGLGLGPQ